MDGIIGVVIFGAVVFVGYFGVQIYTKLLAIENKLDKVLDGEEK